LLAFVLGCFIAYPFMDSLLTIFIQPIGSLIFTHPAGAFSARMNLTLLAGFFLALPFILHQIWMFVSIGLTTKEVQFIKIFIPVSFIFFSLGSIFAYLTVVPFSLRFLMRFARGDLIPMITVDQYISFVGSLLLAFGIIFELPIVLYILAKIGIATPEFLRQKRRHMIGHITTFIEKLLRGDVQTSSFSGVFSKVLQKKRLGIKILFRSGKLGIRYGF